MNKLVTIATPEIADVSKPFVDNLRAYAERWSYDFECVPHKAWPHLHASFSKVAEINRALNEGYEYVVWMDADSAFTNFTRDIKDLIADKLKDRPELWLVGKQQVEWKSWKYINNGVLCIRNTPYTRTYMDQWIDRCLNGCPLIHPGKRTMILDHCWEQWHFDGLIRETQYHGCYACVAKEIGAFMREIWTDGDPWFPGCLSIHAAGPASWERRVEVFKNVYEPQIVK